MKKCSVCSEEKDFNLFYRRSAYKDGYSSSCKSCLIEYNNRYKLENKDKRKETQDKWRKNNPDYCNNWKSNNDGYMKSYLKNWYSNNKEYNNEYQKNRLLVDEFFKVRKDIGIRTRNALKVKYWVGDSNFNLLGCKCDELKTYFEGLFKDGMNWDNYGKWEIDHIIPLSSASNIDELYKLAKYTNIQPLWKEENRSKFITIIKKDI